MLFLEPLGDLLTKVYDKHVLRCPGEPLHMFFCRIKRSGFFTLSGLAYQKTGNDSDSPTSNYLRIEVGGFLIYPGLQRP